MKSFILVSFAMVVGCGAAESAPTQEGPGTRPDAALVDGATEVVPDTHEAQESTVPGADTGVGADASPDVACVPDPDPCGHLCAPTDGCGTAIKCSTCFGGCPVKPGDSIICPGSMHQVECPTATPTSSVCYLGAHDAFHNTWCCPA